jgi:deoxyribodipyrimidine photo-lyase
MKTTAIVWFRNDLRVHDNEALTEAFQRAQYVVPVYVFDDRVIMGKTSHGFDKTGNFRTKFIIEAVADLRKSLKALGADLVILRGKPEEEVFKLAKDLKSSWVYCNRERTHEELTVQDRLEHSLWSVGQELRYARGKMLYHTADLPFPVSQVPDTFTAYRKEIENIVPVRKPFDRPPYLYFPSDLSIELGEVPTLSDFGKIEVKSNALENQKLIGGETAALEQLNTYFWKLKLAHTYKDTRDQLLGWDFSTKFSAWLAHGCLSPKMIYATLKDYEDKVQKNESTYWIYFELLWRDYFRLMGKKYGNRIFKPSGIRDVSVNRNIDWNAFNLWARGETGQEFIDANMIQLNTTGFMSNRGRQNVASYLVKHLNVDWLMGAEYFESLLIDYDPCSNYGNWNYLASIGNDPREDRVFNPVTQAKKYDPNGSFVKQWLALSSV